MDLSTAHTPGGLLGCAFGCVLGAVTTVGSCKAALFSSQVAATLHNITIVLRYDRGQL